jgi:hypothetical protein
MADEDANTARLHMFTSPAWLRRVDEWRARQMPIPNRSEAVRRLVDLGLAASKEKR